MTGEIVPGAALAAAVATVALSRELALDHYLECLACRCALPLMHTADDEPCPHCGGALVIRPEGYEPSCPRCGQSGSNDVCPACLELERAPQGEAIRLFTPAPAGIPGQLQL